MKKIINLILCLMVVSSVAGCSQKTTAEKTTTTQENTAQKTTDVQGQDVKTNVKEKAKSEENTENTLLLLKGKIKPYLAGVRDGVSGILLDEKLDIDGRQVKEVLLDGNIFTDLIPRKYMTYYFEGGTSLKEEFAGKIAVQVKIDPNSFQYDSEYNATIAKLIKVVSLDGETNPRNKTKDEYPIDYYKDVFYALCCPDNINTEYPCTADIKEYYLYKNANAGNDFKMAVDKILEKGLYINMLEGEYVIETKKRYSEEGVGK